MNPRDMHSGFQVIMNSNVAGSEPKRGKRERQVEWTKRVLGRK